MREARFWERKDDKVVCGLCPHHCTIAPGKKGICGVRENQDGKLISLIYGKASSMHVDPIEKKPLFHFMPGEMALSLGSVGCNLRCLHCQNYSISRASADMPGMSDLTPTQVSDICEREMCRIISWTYNEPTIWHEFTYDASEVAKERGLFTSYVTNGFIEEEPLREISPHLDAMNIDVKGFNDVFYKEICGGALEPVLRTVELAHSLGVHVELTYLIIPGHNDSREEIKEFLRWVVSISPEIPVHFTRFHPDYRMMEVESTPLPTLEMAYDLAQKEGLPFVYLGNVLTRDRENTYCPDCGNLAIERSGFKTRVVGLEGSRCDNCGRSLNMVVH